MIHEQKYNLNMLPPAFVVRNCWSVAVPVFIFKVQHCSISPCTLLLTLHFPFQLWDVSFLCGLTQLHLVFHWAADRKLTCAFRKPPQGVPLLNYDHFFRHTASHCTFFESPPRDQHAPGNRISQRPWRHHQTALIWRQQQDVFFTSQVQLRTSRDSLNTRGGFILTPCGTPV